LNPKEFFAELKRRRVYSVAIAYAVGGWALAQGIAQVFPVFDIPNWVVRLIVLFIILGFPIALALSWFFDLTRYGVVRTPNVDREMMPPAVEMDRTRPNERSIAVLPFSDLSPNRDHDYLSDGIAEEILTALSKIDNLHVAARRSAFWFKGKEADLTEIANKLNVEHVLEGTVRRDGDRIRITAELINACDGFTIWSETFEREMQSIFALQDEITRSIVEALKLKLAISAPSPSRSTDAYDSYLQGLFYSDKSTEEALRKSLEFFQRALDQDSQFGRAWTGIAKAWLWLADAYLPPLKAYPKVREAALRALRIDKEQAEAHVYLAETKRILDWDLDGAETEFNRAFEMDPNLTPSNYFIAAFYAARGDRERALAYLQRTSKIDPASLWVNNFACEIYRYFGLNDEAIAAGERALQLDPAFAYGEPLLAALYREMGRFDEAIALYNKSENLSGRPPFGLAITYARMNQREKALRALEVAAKRRSYTAGDAIAHVHVALGDYDNAIRELERAREEHSSSLHLVGIAPEFGPLRSDERFLSILREIGLEPDKVFAAAPVPAQNSSAQSQFSPALPEGETDVKRQ
jgi:TolB-like protein/tetratricopeptide (TPR) repeat protein